MTDTPPMPRGPTGRPFDPNPGPRPGDPPPDEDQPDTDWPEPQPDPDPEPGEDPVTHLLPNTARLRSMDPAAVLELIQVVRDWRGPLVDTWRIAAGQRASE